VKVQVLTDVVVPVETNVAGRVLFGKPDLGAVPKGAAFELPVYEANKDSPAEGGPN
jgi:hypothetical protein